MNAFPNIAALFVETDGCYFGLPGIDPWDIHRDARKYAGPYPVIAHPPCERWGAMAAVNYARWGGERNRPGNDGGCFKSALESLRKWGGVLEHPAKSRAWAHYGLQKPTGTGWTRTTDGWVCEVWQSAYGHRANKATWLYFVGNEKPIGLNWTRPKGSHQVGFYDQRGKDRNKPTLPRKEARATPIKFRDALIRLAANEAHWRYRVVTPANSNTETQPPRSCGFGGDHFATVPAEPLNNARGDSAERFRFPLSHEQEVTQP